MKFLTLDHIRQQLRIDQTGEEDAVLELYGSAAEDTVLNICNRTIDDVIETYGGVPDAMRQATLMLVGQSYMNREPSSMQNMSAVPYSFDLLIKPYMRLTDNCASGGRRLTYAVLGSDIMIEFEADLPDEIKLQDVDFSVVVYNVTAIDKKLTLAKDQCVISDDGTGCSVFFNTEDLGVGQLMLRVIYQIPDASWPNGTRKDVRKINPYIIITG